MIERKILFLMVMWVKMEIKCNSMLSTTNFLCSTQKSCMLFNISELKVEGHWGYKNVFIASILCNRWPCDYQLETKMKININTQSWPSRLLQPFLEKIVCHMLREDWTSIIITILLLLLLLFSDLPVALLTKTKYHINLSFSTWT